MKTRLLIIIGIVISMGVVIIIPHAYAQCVQNDDWLDRPCLDGGTRGSYFQREVDKWSQYYDYKGSDIMEFKKLEMNKIIQQNNLEKWIRESHENYNVWSYYYFSGEAPDIPSESSTGFELINREEKPLQNIFSHHHPFWHDPDTFPGLLFIGLYIIGMVILVKVFQKRNTSKLKIIGIVFIAIVLFMFLGTIRI